MHTELLRVTLMNKDINWKQTISILNVSFLFISLISSLKK